MKTNNRPLSNTKIKKEILRPWSSLITIILACLVSTAIIGNNVSAAMCGGVETIFIECEGGGDAGIYHILALVLDILSMGVGILGVIGISWAGIQYITAGGNTTKTMKAKQRLFEIVIGVSLYAVLWSLTGWLLPTKHLNLFPETSEESEVKMAYSGVTESGITFTPSVTFEDDVSNKTYSLLSSDKNIAITLGRSVKCVAPGKATIKAVTSGGKTTDMTITCKARTIVSNNGTTTGRIAIDGTATVGAMGGVSFNGKPHMRISVDRIVKNHNKDFYYNNYKTEIRKRGGYNNYVRSLGGVFTQFGSQLDAKGNIKKINVKTAADFQAAAEYVYGLWMIWGPDYGNGQKHVSWKSNDAFYRGQPGREGQKSYTTEDINSVLRSSTKVRTNCNCAIDTFYKSTTLGPYGSSKRKGIARGRKWSEMKVGDLVNFYRDGKWRHIAMVGEVYRDYIVMYDGGSRLQNDTNYKFAIPRKNDSVLRGTYSSYTSWNWFRPWNIDQSVTLKGIN